jgi:purine-binding chemotaxis protein CheW
MAHPTRKGDATATRAVLVFVLGAERYGVDILKVQEIRSYGAVMPIPTATAFLKGVINLRGVIVPVIDLRARFGLADARFDELTVAIVLRVGSQVIGAVVDSVSDVIALRDEEVKPAPRLGALVDASFLAGVATRDDGMVLLLDVERLLSSAELDLLDRAAAARPATDLSPESGR